MKPAEVLRFQVAQLVFGSMFPEPSLPSKALVLDDLSPGAGAPGYSKTGHTI